ncbi:hypothetical protein MPSEU_000535400 [Mayamaea pseudoterrestris]|nr:hypothetical protein MPSEU_000535400 [Mayamaea pseudoterrestris]
MPVILKIIAPIDTTHSITPDDCEITPHIRRLELRYVYISLWWKQATINCSAAPVPSVCRQQQERQRQETMNILAPKKSDAARALQDEVLKSHMVDDSIYEDIEDGKSSNENSSSAGHSSSNPSTTDFGSRTGGEERATEICAVTKQDTKNVNRTKFLVYLSLIFAATTVGTLTYFFTKRSEDDSFTLEFAEYADAAHQTIDATTKNIFGQIKLLSVTLTSHSLANGAFPNVTISRFDRRADEARKLSGSGLIYYAPIVKESQRKGWEQYAYENQEWVYTDWLFHEGESGYEQNPGNISRNIYGFHDAIKILDQDPLWEKTVKSAEWDSINQDLSLSEDLGPPSPVIDEPFYLPIWEAGPVPRNASVCNFDLYTKPAFKPVVDQALEINRMLFSRVWALPIVTYFMTHGELIYTEPESFLLHPIYEDFHPDAKTVAFIIAKIEWHSFFVNILPPGVNGVLVEVEGSCGDRFSYLMNGNETTYLGTGHYHEEKYEGMKLDYDFAEDARYDGPNKMTDLGACDYTIAFYPTAEFAQSYYTNKPAVYCILVVMVFVFTLLLFAAYDYMVYRRQAKLVFTAARTKAIVSSLFPKEVHDRIMAEAEAQAHKEEAAKRTFGFAPKSQLREFLAEDAGQDMSGDAIFKTKPIADLFPAVTVMFADLVGFTAWSSMREPAQVFILLETLYNEFDQIAKRRRVFKVETIGDCYVAVCGLPEPRKDHATVMCRFARDCLYKIDTVTKSLELSLGPDTAELGLRIGLHSGPVTAGVLRGERARFQLFGDTVNGTARIETTGVKNRIHLSPETAEVLQGAGKGHWARLREDKIVINSASEVQTFWLDIKGSNAKSQTSGASGSDDTHSNADDDEDERDVQVIPNLTKLNEAMKENVGQKINPLSERNMRLVSWNIEILYRILREQVARRQALGIKAESVERMQALEMEKLDCDTIAIDEVQDTLQLPKFDAAAAKRQKSATDIELDDTVHQQLTEFIQTMAALYRSNPFHNFEHASHVTMSVVKLLSRIIAPEIESESQDAAHKNLHDHTFGITSDPLTQLGVVMAALIHDVDHTGIPNSQLIVEQTSIASYYNQKSIAEQNSLDIAWEVLMQDCFKDLRRVIYTTTEEFKRFRQLLVNVVLSTDIMDKDLSAKRKERWNFAFDGQNGLSVSERNDRKATIVIEHLIQASDVAHTMQHWHIYRKWNARLFEEQFKAWKDGRSQTDPTHGWYQGEIGFFDFYIIPLAKKLKDCGVFGVSSDEYLNYALHNRREWEIKGQGIISEMVEQMKAKYLW